MSGTTPKAILAILLFGVTITALQAQDRIDMAAVGLSVEVPGSWTDLKTSDLTEHAPEFAFYHIQVSENGKFVALRREECQAEEKQAQWVSGEIEAAQMGPDDTIAPLADSAAVTFDDHAGYLIISPRERFTYRSYSFNWVEHGFCYRAQVGAPDNTFAASSSEFQQIIDSIRPLE